MIVVKGKGMDLNGAIGGPILANGIALESSSFNRRSLIALRIII
jgi:hypothetical protein